MPMMDDAAIRSAALEEAAKLAEDHSKAEYAVYHDLRNSDPERASVYGYYAAEAHSIATAIRALKEQP